MRGAFLVFALAVALDAQNRGTVAGTVVSQTSGNAVRRATVILKPATAGQTSYAAETDDSGGFSMDGIPAGVYTCAASRAGFTEHPPHNVGSGTRPALVEVKANATASMTLRMMPLGVISGRIIDEEGGPVRNAEVVAMQYSAFTTGRSEGEGVHVISNDRGEFRLHGLYPGGWYLRVNPPRPDLLDGPVMILGMAALTRMYTPRTRLPTRGTPQPEIQTTFYPGVEDSGSATPVDVPAGGERGGMEIRMPRRRLFSVRGRLPGGEDNLTITVEKRPADPHFRWAGTQSSHEGQFDVGGLAPGSYTLDAELPARSSTESRMYATVSVDIYDADVEGLELRFQPGVSVSGTVRVVGRTPLAVTDVVPMLVGRDMDRWGVVGTVGEDGGLSIENAVPETYHLRIQTPGVYVVGLKNGEREGAGQTLDLRNGAIEELEVTVSADTGMVEGMAPAGSFITLIPAESGWDWRDRYREVTADDEGRYRVEGVVPGRYTAFAWHDVEQGAPKEASFRRRYEAFGVPVSVKPLERISVELKEADASEMKATVR